MEQEQMVPYILLFAPHSPVICKDFFSLVYMYKSSRYYAVFHIDLGSIFPQSTLLQLHCSLQAFGLYCQWLPGLTTKSIHCYLYSHYFRMRFTSITLRIPPLMLSFHSMPLNPLVPKLTTWLSADAQIPTTQQLTHVNYIIESHIQAATSIINIFWQSHIKILNKFITEASICEVTGDPPVVGPSRTGHNSEPPNELSSGDTTPMPSTYSPNNAAIQGNAPNPRGKDLNPDDDPILSDHGSFRSDCLRHGNVPEPTELLAQAMSRLVDFVTKAKQEILSMKVWDPDPFNGSNPKKTLRVLAWMQA